MGGINDLGAIRERLNWTQQRMADALDIGLRTYVEAEASDRPRKAYVLAAQYLASLDPSYGFDCAVPMSDGADEDRAQATAAMYTARAALGIALRYSSNPEEGFNLSAFLWDESCAQEMSLVARRGAYLAGEVVHSLTKEEADDRAGKAT